MKTVFTYRAVNACDMLFGGCAIVMEKDAYITGSKEIDAARQALAEGYRWIRTETINGTEYAILERVEVQCDVCSGSGVVNKNAQPDDYDKGTCGKCYGRGSLWL